MTFASEGFLDLFLPLAAAEPERLFARFNGTPVLLGDLDRMSASFAAALAARGISPGARVAVMMRNSPATLAVLFGIARAGAVWVPVNAQQRGEGLKYILEHSAPEVIVVDADLRSTLTDSGAATGDAWVIQAGPTEELEAILAEPAAWSAPAPPPQDLFAIMYTSGTTGQPKGVMVTHLMMRLAGQAVAQVSAVRDGDALFVWEPLYHIGGAQLIVLPLLAKVHLAMVDRFSASRFWDQVRAEGATHIHYLGGILQILLKQAARADDRQHNVRIAWGGGCALEVWRAFEARFGVQIRECYGMTEASSITTCNDRGVLGSVGREMPWFDVALLDGAGQPVALGERGEIVVSTRLPGAICPGYFRNPEATARALKGGALHTGDLGSRDGDGNLFFHGRMTDSVRCKGENVSAWEVEHVAATHPAVEDCAIIGVKAEVGEQDIKLFVKPKAGATIDPIDLTAWLAPKLAPYQMPRYVAVVEEFERTPSLRIMKHRLSPRTDDCFDRLTPAV